MPSRCNVILVAALLFLSSGSLNSVNGQKCSPGSPKTAIPPVPPPKEDKWWVAQRSIEAAIQQLESYLRENPNGTRAATARQQLEVLRNLSITASRPEWVKMDSIGILEVSEWRVASVERLADKTRISIEIRCGRQDGGDCHFLPFDRAPLVVVDNNGQYYPMVESMPFPGSVKYRTDGQAIINSGRILNLTVDFPALPPGSVSSQIYYRDNNQAKPALFRSLAPSN
jgi:hypothetical protein